MHYSNLTFIINFILFSLGVSHKLNGTTSNLTGKKRPFNGIKINQNVSKRRILSDGSIHNTNIQRGLKKQYTVTNSLHCILKRT